MIVAPVLLLLMLFVLWAGRAGRVGLVADLAAEEAAVAAGVACVADRSLGITPQQRDACAEAVAADVLWSRPGLSYLCIGGPQPPLGGGADGIAGSPDEGFVTLEGPVVAVAVACDTDGAVVPLRGVFPTVQFQGHAIYVAPAAR